MNNLGKCIHTKAADAVDLAKRYLTGLLPQVPRKKMDRIDERADNYQRLQQFIADNPWDEDLFYREITAQANARLGGRPDTLLIIYESAHEKKCPGSAGAVRQWNGRLDNRNNCQIDVHSALIGIRLFLPEQWTGEEARCYEAGVLEKRWQCGFLTKIGFAGELIVQALADGDRFACVALDALCGRDNVLRRALTERDLVYYADISLSTRIFIEKPLMERRLGQFTPATISVEEHAAGLMADAAHPARTITLWEGENGLVESKVWNRRVWEWPEEEAAPEGLWLIIPEDNPGQLKCSLSNTPARRGWQAGRSDVFIWSVFFSRPKATAESSVSWRAITEFKTLTWFKLSHMKIIYI